MERTRLERLGAQMLDLLVPCRCLGCNAIEPGSMPLGLCSLCRPRLDDVDSPRRRACDLCGASLRTLRAQAGKRPRRCIPCLAKRSPLDRLYCAWSYREPLDAVIQGLKFEGLSYLGEHLAQELDRRLPVELAVDAVVPVPLHWRRSWARGYNQATEIARPLARRRSWRLSQALARRRATPAQSALGRARRLVNLRRAFALRGRRAGRAIRGKRLLLIDDVYTTGATLEAAALALRRGGAAWVGGAVAGRTEGPKYYR